MFRAVFANMRKLVKPRIAGKSVVLLRRCIVAAITAACLCGTAWAGTVVVANRTSRNIEMTIRFSSGGESSYTLRSAQVVPIQASRSIHVSYRDHGTVRGYTLDPYHIYYFQNDREGLSIAELGVEQIAPVGRVVAVRPSDHRQKTQPILENGRRRRFAQITLKVFVDDEEDAPPQVWQDRLRERIAAASNILERHAWVRLKITGFGRWESDDSHLDFFRALAEFERAVQPGEARVALGFSSQYGRIQAQRGGTKLGGTRGPFHPYILVREWPRRVTKPEAVEVLVHELGHYLGCVHSVEPDSAMRPLLANHNRSLRMADIRFDPLNTMIMNLVSEEMRDYDVFDFRRMGFETKLRLFNIYREMYRVSPRASQADDYVKRMGPLLVKKKPMADSAKRSAPSAAPRRAARRTVQRKGGSAAVQPNVGSAAR